MRWNSWSCEEDSLVREYYPIESWSKLLSLFPKRHRVTIAARAKKLKVRRKCHGLNQSTMERFWNKVNKTSGIYGESGNFPSECWTWKASTHQGYAEFWDDKKKSMTHAHKFLYESINGPVLSHLELDHLCRIRHCVNPSHLEPVTPKENTLRGTGPTSINAKKTHCINGHLFDEKNTYVNEGRNCRQCIRDKRGQKPWLDHCPKGHTDWKFNKNGHRLCKTCEKIKNAKQAEYRKERYFRLKGRIS